MRRSRKHISIYVRNCLLFVLKLLAKNYVILNARIFKINMRSIIFRVCVFALICRKYVDWLINLNYIRRKKKCGSIKCDNKKCNLKKRYFYLHLYFFFFTRNMQFVRYLFIIFFNNICMSSITILTHAPEVQFCFFFYKITYWTIYM